MNSNSNSVIENNAQSLSAENLKAVSFFQSEVFGSQHEASDMKSPPQHAMDTTGMKVTIEDSPGLLGPGEAPQPSSSDSSGAAVERAAREAVIEANLGDLEELSSDIEGATVYSLRNDTLQRWAAVLRNSIEVIRQQVHGLGTESKPSSAHGSVHSMHGMQSSGRLTGGQSIRLKRGQSMAPGMDRKATMHDAISAMRGTDSGARSGAVTTVGGSVSSAVYLLLEACASAIHADWSTCFIYQAKTEQLVLACGTGKRQGKPGSLKVPANVGVESHVMNTGIAVNIAHAYVEEEFSPNIDKGTNTRTKTQLVFPLMKPGTTSVAFGVIEFGNKQTGTGFTPEDESKVAQCSQLLALIISKYPSDITNPSCFDPSIFPKDQEKVPSILAGLAIPGGRLQEQLVHRTARVGHLKRAEVMRDAAGLNSIPTITEAIGHVTQVNEAWRNAVILNIELEREISRLHEALRVSRRETTRLQGAIQECKRKEEAAANDGVGLMRKTSGGMLSAASPSLPRIPSARRQPQVPAQPQVQTARR